MLYSIFADTNSTKVTTLKVNKYDAYLYSKATNTKDSFGLMDD